jgi:hypothetical protein
VTEPTSEQIRTALEDATVDAPAPHPWAEIERRAGSAGDPASSTLRPRIWLAAAACVVALIVGLVILPGSGDDEIRQDDSPSIVPGTTTPSTTPPTTTVDASTTVAPETTTAPSETPVPSGSEQPPALSRPVSGQTQQSVVGDITWTLIDGDASNVPQGPVVGVDGGYLGGVYDGRTWRSSEGLEWELVDLGGDGVDDESVFGEFEFRGETWARTSDDAGARSNDGLARWDGETFVPVALPESPFEGLDGLRISDRFVGAPVVVGDELVVSVTTLLEVPWGELFAGDDVHAEWPGAPEPIRIVDWSSGQDLAVLSAEFIDGEPGRFEFRDVESNEVVTTVETVSGVDPAAVLPRILEGVSREILIGDADGFEAFEPPGGWGAPGTSGSGEFSGDVVPIDGGVLGITRVGNRVPSLGDQFSSDDWELWTSADARSWTELDLPIPVRSPVEHVSMASDGSTALLHAWVDIDGQLPFENLWWATADGRRWEEVTTPVGGGSRPAVMVGLPLWIRPAEFGWLVDNFEYNIAISPDGRTWQEVQFDFDNVLGDGGASAVGRSIFVVPTPGAEEPSGPTHSMWVGRVADG